MLHMMLPAEPSHLERLAVVVMVHLGLGGTRLHLARHPFDMTAREVDMGVGPRTIAKALCIRERVALAPPPHSIGMAAVAQARSVAGDDGCCSRPGTAPRAEWHMFEVYHGNTRSA